VAGAGTVTLLFTDLVGSTELLVALGEDRYDSVRDEHEVLVGGTIAAYHGEVVKSTGDGYMAVFLRAGDAVGAAAEIQRLIARRNEDSEVALGVRIGISSGDVIERSGDYHGAAVVEAARLCAAATGGQILATETVRSLVGSRGGHDFVTLGDVDLKGLPPVATVAVRWCDDAPVFAPTGGLKGNLPASLDRFIGRQHDLDAIRALLGKRRLVTLTGPGGSGKTRLALEVGRSIGAEHADGIWLVDLAPIDDERLVAEATMAALGLRGSDAPAREELRSHLAGRDTLLLVDNCEQVLGGTATLIAELLGACPRVRVVATSREPLRVPGEAEYAVGGLGREEAVELFAERVPGRRGIDDLGCERVVVLGASGPPALQFAATHPERTSALVLINPTARFRRADDYPQGLAEENLEAFVAWLCEVWGTGRVLSVLAPSVAEDARFTRWFARCERVSNPPQDAAWRLRASFEVDVRHLLPVIRVPTLVVVRTGAPGYDQGRYVADHIDGARYVELAGEDTFFFTGDTRPLLNAIEEFVTGRLPRHDVNRVLATVMFTDVVSSTDQAAGMGDRRWSELLATHDGVTRAEFERFRGREIKTTGDGFLATFDGPGRAVRCACAIRDAVRAIGIQVRVGLHTGEIELHADDIGGIAVHIAQRVQALAQRNEVLVSRTVADLVGGSGILFADRGTHALKGVPDEWRLFAVEDSPPLGSHPAGEPVA
jgi:class 3 adenylate cyclase